MRASNSLRRLAAITAVGFVLILAFLAGRVHGGADPAQADTRAARVPPAVAPAPAPRGDEQGDDEGFLPDPGTLPSPGGQDPDPPMTQAS